MSKLDIFISYSGDEGKKTAIALRESLIWLFSSDLISPFVAEATIPNGTQWYQSVQATLIKSQFLISIVDKRYVSSPWGAFEVGCFSGMNNFKNDKTSVFPILFGIDEKSIETSPLTGLSCGVYSPSLFKELVVTIRSHLGSISDHQHSQYENLINPEVWNNKVEGAQKIIEKTVVDQLFLDTNSSEDPLDHFLKEWTSELKRQISKVSKSISNIKLDMETNSEQDQSGNDQLKKLSTFISGKTEYNNLYHLLKGYRVQNLREDIINVVKPYYSFMTGRDTATKKAKKLYFDQAESLMKDTGDKLSKISVGSLVIFDSTKAPNFWKKHMTKYTNKTIWTINTPGTLGRKMDKKLIDKMARIVEGEPEPIELTRVFVIYEKNKSDIKNVLRTMEGQLNAGVNVGAVFEDDFNSSSQELFERIHSRDFMIIDESLLYITHVSGGVQDRAKTIVKIEFRENPEDLSFAKDAMRDVNHDAIFFNKKAQLSCDYPISVKDFNDWKRDIEANYLND